MEAIYIRRRPVNLKIMRIDFNQLVNPPKGTQNESILMPLIVGRIRLQLPGLQYH